MLPFNCTASEIHFRLAVDSGMSAEDGKKDADFRKLGSPCLRAAVTEFVLIPAILSIDQRQPRGKGRSAAIFDCPEIYSGLTECAFVESFKPQTSMPYRHIRIFFQQFRQFRRHFSCGIDATSFTYLDMTFRRNGSPNVWWLSVVLL